MPRLASLAHFIVRHRRAVIGIWVLLTLFGAFSAGQVSKRWFESFSIPGYSSYEANQRTLKTFGTGEQSPLVAVFHSSGDVTKATGIKDAIAAAAKVNPGSRVSSFWSTGSRAYVSKDGHTAFAEIYPPGTPTFSSSVHIDQVRARLKDAARRPDADRDGGRRDPEHLQPRLGPHVCHERVDHRPVPDRPGRTRRGDRLRVVDDLPFPRRASRGRRRRDRAHRDDDPCGALGDRLRLDGRRRTAVDGDPAAALHPLDRNRRDADPGGLGDRGDHAPAGAAGDARHADQQRAAAAEAARRQRPSRGRPLGPLGGACDPAAG